MRRIIPDEWLRRIDLRKLVPAIPDFRAMLDEREYRKLEKLGAKKGIPIPGMFITREAFWSDGSPIFPARRARSHSVNRNYYNMIFCYANWKALSDATFGTGLLSLTDVPGNVIRTTNGFILIPLASYTANIDARHTTSHLLATAGSIANGIVIGTNSGAEDFEGYALGAIIANGSAGGEMDYSQSELHSITNNVLTLKNTLVRDFNNNSGGAITVEEVAIYVGVEWQTPADKQIMITRDLTGGDAIADTAQYRVTYECTLTYPS